MKIVKSTEDSVKNKVLLEVGRVQGLPSSDGSVCQSDGAQRALGHIRDGLSERGSDRRGQTLILAVLVYELGRQRQNNFRGAFITNADVKQ